LSQPLNSRVIGRGKVISDLHRQIADAVRTGVDLDEIERNIIDRAPIVEDERSALWLYAQALSERPVRRDHSLLASG
jgi:hypothetical protein